MLKNGLVSVLAAVVIGAGGAAAEAPKIPGPDAPRKEIIQWFNEVTTKVEISLDPILREIVCKVAYQPFAVDMLTRSMHVSGKKIRDAVDKLQMAGLVKIMVSEGYDLVAPASDEARVFMRRWAGSWCTNDDSCEVQK